MVKLPLVPEKAVSIQNTINDSSVNCFVVNEDCFSFWKISFVVFSCFGKVCPRQYFWLQLVYFSSFALCVAKGRSRIFSLQWHPKVFHMYLACCSWDILQCLRWHPMGRFKKVFEDPSSGNNQREGSLTPRYSQNGILSKNHSDSVNFGVPFQSKKNKMIQGCLLGDTLQVCTCIYQHWFCRLWGLADVFPGAPAARPHISTCQ